MQPGDQTLTTASSLIFYNPAFTATTDKFERKSYSAGLTAKTRELSSEYLLWRAVLGQAVRDVYQGDIADRAEVIRWLRTTDFLTVCEYAHAEPDQMRQQIAALCELPTILAKKYGKMLRDKIVEDIYND